MREDVLVFAEAQNRQRLCFTSEKAPILAHFLGFEARRRRELFQKVSEFETFFYVGILKPTQCRE